MFKGGYKLIDFKDVNIPLTGTVKIEGIYDSIENSYRKPLILTGLVIDNMERNDVYVTSLIFVNNKYIAGVNFFSADDTQYRIQVSDNDEVGLFEI